MQEQYTWRQWVDIEEEFLDTIDLKPYLKSGADLQEVMNQIEEQEGCYYIREEFIFNNMDIGDFIQYLQHRYPDLDILEEERITYTVM